jgi:hypothetical protein
MAIRKFKSNNVSLSNNTYTIPSFVEYLVVAGGGGGSFGGGGAGGFVTGSTTVSRDTSYTVTVGNGGNGSITSSIATSGGNSVFGSIEIPT